MAFKKKNHKCKKEIGFIWIDEDFFNYCPILLVQFST